MNYFKYLFLFLFVASFVACNNEIDEEDLVCENPTVFFSQLELRYTNFNGQNKVIIPSLSCDVCQIGIEGAEACKCRKDCAIESNQIYQECKEEEWWDQCKAIWEYEVSIGDNYNSLENECCPESGSFEFNCKQACGSVPEPIREPIGYTYGAEIWTSSTTILTNVPSTAANNIIVGDEIEGAPSSISIDIADYLDSSTISFCIETTVVILYDDGKCCMYKDRLCMGV